MVKIYSEPTLDALFDSPIKVKLLKLFLYNPDENFESPVISKKLNLRSVQVNRNLDDLVDIKFLSCKNLKGKIAVILAKNPVFANPLSNLLKKRGIKVSVEVSPPQTKKADILTVALGRPNFIKPEMVKKNSIIIDVGYTRANGRPMGDVSPEVVEKTGYLSPVPGGVGPLTVAYLLKNVYLSAKRALQNSKK